MVVIACASMAVPVGCGAPTTPVKDFVGSFESCDGRRCERVRVDDDGSYVMSASGEWPLPPLTGAWHQSGKGCIRLRLDKHQLSLEPGMTGEEGIATRYLCLRDGRYHLLEDPDSKRLGRPLVVLP